MKVMPHKKDRMMVEIKFNDLDYTFTQFERNEWVGHYDDDEHDSQRVKIIEQYLKAMYKKLMDNENKRNNAAKA